VPSYGSAPLERPPTLRPCPVIGTRQGLPPAAAVSLAWPVEAGGPRRPRPPPTSAGYCAGT
jgi:hypothetical protein